MVNFLAALALLPFVSAEVHRLKLKKVAPTIPNPDLESLYLAEKYGAAAPQVPVISSPSRILRQFNRNGEPIYWTQDDVNGGHKVPLSSTFSLLLSACSDPDVLFYKTS